MTWVVSASCSGRGLPGALDFSCFASNGLCAVIIHWRRFYDWLRASPTGVVGIVSISGESLGKDFRHRYPEQYDGEGSFRFESGSQGVESGSQGMLAEQTTQIVISRHPSAALRLPSKQ